MNTRQYLIVCGTALFSVMGVAGILPTLPLLAKNFNISDAGIGILIAGFTLPGVILTPLGGVLSDRLGRKKVLIPSLALFALGGLGCFFSGSQTEIVFWRIVQGVGAASLGTLYNTLIGDLCPDETARLKALSGTMILVAMGGALFSSLGGLLGEWRLMSPFLLTLCALPLALLVCVTKLPRPAGTNENLSSYMRQGIGRISERGNLSLFAVSFIIFGILYGPIITYFPLLAYSRHEASPSQIGAVYAATILGISFGGLFTPRLFRRFSKRALGSCAAAFFCAAMLLMPHGASLWFCTAPLLCYGLGQGILYPAAMSVLTGGASEHTRSMVLAANATTIRLSQTLMPSLCGLVYTWWSFEGVFGGGLLLAGLLFLLAPAALSLRA
ncbi:MAG: MFS transporter [Deltaproteobacteria bacterium]|jgi:MFS family permease|nr:MFS transporter [Deltaproteobacteria bacterium]